MTAPEGVEKEGQFNVLRERGHLGFNAKYLIEMGEETGSRGLRELCEAHRNLFAADVLIPSIQGQIEDIRALYRRLV